MKLKLVALANSDSNSNLNSTLNLNSNVGPASFACLESETVRDFDLDSGFELGFGFDFGFDFGVETVWVSMVCANANANAFCPHAQSRPTPSAPAR